MRIFIILPFSLIIILANLQRTTANDCRCECCTSQDCSPTLAGIQPLWYCTEATSCTQTKCVEWYPDKCPPRDAFGQTRALCVSSVGERTLPTLFIIISIAAIILLIKDKL